MNVRGSLSGRASGSRKEGEGPCQTTRRQPAAASYPLGLPSKLVREATERALSLSLSLWNVDIHFVRNHNQYIPKAAGSSSCCCCWCCIPGAVAAAAAARGVSARRPAAAGQPYIRRRRRRRSVKSEEEQIWIFNEFRRRR